jgi:chromosome segregation ATPase
MSPQEIIEQLKHLGSELHRANKELYETSIKKSEAEKKYRTKLAQKILILRTEKYPATLIQDIARGDEEISLLKLERDKYEALYDACKYNINSIHERISIGQSLLNWLRNEYQYANKIGG